MIELESFEPDIKELTDNIYIGPQAEILELIRHFNQHYVLRYGMEEIGVTNKFYWKPGTYPKFKELIIKILQIPLIHKGGYAKKQRKRKHYKSSGFVRMKKSKKRKYI